MGEFEPLRAVGQKPDEKGKGKRKMGKRQVDP